MCGHGQLQLGTKQTHPLVAALVLGLLTMPTVIITASESMFVATSAIVIITAISTIFLYAAYGVVIYLGATTQGWLSERVWSLGRYSKPIAWIAVGWVLVLMVLFSFPTSGNISWPFMLVLALAYAAEIADNSDFKTRITL